MGDVRIKVTLRNALDQALVRRGQMAAADVRSYDADALIDTGAVRCVLPAHVAQQLGLQSVGRRVAEYADGRLEAVELTEPFVLEVLGRSDTEDAMVLGDEVLIGQTALEKLDLVGQGIYARASFDMAQDALSCAEGRSAGQPTLSSDAQRHCERGPASDTRRGLRPRRT